MVAMTTNSPLIGLTFFTLLTSCRANYLHFHSYAASYYCLSTGQHLDSAGVFNYQALSLGDPFRAANKISICGAKAGLALGNCSSGECINGLTKIGQSCFDSQSSGVLVSQCSFSIFIIDNQYVFFCFLFF